MGKKLVNYSIEKSKRRRRKFKPMRAVYFFLTIVGIYFFLHSPIFNIQNIVIVGNNYLPSEKVLKLSQVSQGDNLFKIDKEDIKDNISVHPLVKDIKIDRRLPHTLNITIIERRPIGLLVCKDGFIQVSETGVFLSLINDIGTYKLPVISGVSMDVLPGPGQVIQNQGLKNALGILASISSDLLENLAEINVADSKHILAYTLQGIEIRLGSEENVQDKLQQLQDILEQIINKEIDERSIEYIDLRISGRPIIMPKK